MNLKGDEQLKSLRELASKNNHTVAFLKKQISLGKLQFEKKGSSFYSTQAWVDDYRKSFTFDGFMLERIFPDNELSTGRDNKATTKEKHKTAKIIKEENSSIDLEEALVSKWNNEFRKINNNFNSLLESDKKNKKVVGRQIYKNTKSVYVASLSAVILFLMAINFVVLTPNTALSFTNKIDSIVRAPYNYLNQKTVNSIFNNDTIVQGEVDSEQLSNFIKNKINNISYPSGTTLDIEKKDIVGRVAGIEEEYSETKEMSLFNKIKESTIEAFTKMSEKQKKASLKLSEKMDSFISSLTD